MDVYRISGKLTRTERIVFDVFLITYRTLRIIYALKCRRQIIIVLHHQIIKTRRSNTVMRDL